MIRLDSLSKVLCPGFRLGFCTAPPKLVTYMERHYAVSSIEAGTDYFYCYVLIRRIYL